MSTLIIAEKPSVASDIAKVIGANNRGEGYYHGNGYIVSYAIGHLFSLQDPDYYNDAYKSWNKIDLPILIKDFKLKLKPETAKQFKVLKDLLSKASLVINAGDSDREGELIQNWIYQQANYKGKIQRLWFSSLTEEALKKAFNNLLPGETKRNLFYAGEERSFADWNIGMNATRALTISSSSRSVLSIGRVQTPTLAMICKRYLENKNFVPVAFYVPSITLTKSGQNFKANYKSEKQIFAPGEAKSIIDKIGSSVICKEAKTKEFKEKQPLLFDLVSLQKECNKTFGYSAQQTLDIMQSLYEKHKVLTYPRTDSCYITSDIFKDIPSLIKTSLSLLPVNGAAPLYDMANLPKRSVSDEKASSHHAIIPTGKIPGTLIENEKNVFITVLKRFLASFLPECSKSTTSYIFESNGLLFAASGTIINYPGWRIIIKDEIKDQDQQNLPIIKEGETIHVVNKEVINKKTIAPPLLTEDKLLDLMIKCGKDLDLAEEEMEAIKEKGIGTPVTRSGIIEILLKRGYICREKKYLIPTAVGLALYNQVKDLKIANPELTGEWEYQLLQIEQGKMDRYSFRNGINTYCSEVVNELLTVGEKMQTDLSRIEKESSIQCPSCKKGFLKPNSKAYSCSEYKAGCSFVIWTTIAGKKITGSHVKQLVQKGSTGLIKGFTGKKGKFDAKLKLNNQRIEFIF